MSTIRTLLFVIAPVAAMAMGTTPPKQQGVGTGKLAGPSLITTSSTSLHTPGKDGSYTYTVTLTGVSATDQTINVYDETGSLVTDSPVVVPAGQLSVDFQVSALYPSDDTLTATNGVGSASMEVQVV